MYMYTTQCIQHCKCICNVYNTANVYVYHIKHTHLQCCIHTFAVLYTYICSVVYVHLQFCIHTFAVLYTCIPPKTITQESTLAHNSGTDCAYIAIAYVRLPKYNVTLLYNTANVYIYHINHNTIHDSGT